MEKIRPAVDSHFGVQYSINCLSVTSAQVSSGGRAFQIEEAVNSLKLERLCTFLELPKDSCGERLPLKLLFRLSEFVSTSIGDLLFFGGQAITSISLFYIVGVLANVNILLLLAVFMLPIFSSRETILLCLSDCSDSILYTSLSSSCCLTLSLPINYFVLLGFLSKDIRGLTSLISISFTFTILFSVKSLSSPSL